MAAKQMPPPKWTKTQNNPVDIFAEGLKRPDPSVHSRPILAGIFQLTLPKPPLVHSILLARRYKSIRSTKTRCVPTVDNQFQTTSKNQLNSMPSLRKLPHKILMHGLSVNRRKPRNPLAL